MTLRYDIDRCQETLQSLNDLLDCLEEQDTCLYRELADIEATWESTSRDVFFKAVLLNEEQYLKQLLLFRDALASFELVHQTYVEAKGMVENKFKEIQYG